jgi:plastocyanin
MYTARERKQYRNMFYSIFTFSILITSFLFTIAGCSKNDMSTNSPPPGANEIFIQGMAFSPANKTISVGTTIKWTNKDGVTHTVTSGVPGSPSGLFDSGNFGSNDVFSFAFSQAGTFKYYCKIHSSMTGTITVQ